MRFELLAQDSVAKPVAMRRAFACALAAAIAIAPTGWSRAQSSSADPLIAKVDDTELHQSDLALADEYIGRDMRDWDSKQAKHDVLLRFLSDMILLSRAATKEKIADENELQRRATFVRNKALMDKLLQITAQSAVTEETLHKAYEQALLKNPPQPETRFRTIFFKFEDAKNEAAVKAAEDRANAAYERIIKGEDFAKVARETSDHPGGKLNGGDAGFMTQAAMGSDFAEAAAKLDIGGVSPPFKSLAGWHLIKIEERQLHKPQDFETVRDRIAAVLVRQAQIDLINKLRSAAKIERFDTPAEPAQPTDASKPKE